MTKIFNLPNKIPIFPLSNFIIFPNTNVPLNIFEPRYIQMVDDSMKGNRMIGIIQPKKKLIKFHNYTILDVWEKLRVSMKLMMADI